MRGRLSVGAQTRRMRCGLRREFENACPIIGSSRVVYPA
ncbi:hypothetical protein ABIA16_000808 [Sinorhizobium fredii]